ncbi:MAG TPA: septal ring lytic transglycosylase RlpA family protein [Bryobacteraceae bacterium]|nr:septal ring lytic transglycosylase RlpA family protein [Bryobacteraceae bacterium]
MFGREVKKKINIGLTTRPEGGAALAQTTTGEYVFAIAGRSGAACSEFECPLLSIQRMMRRHGFRLALLAVALLCLIPMAGCRKKHNAVAHAPAPAPRHRVAAVPVAVGHSEEGIASWYGVPYNGRAAADGEIYDMETLVAAHRTMPFNTWVRVTNLSNHKSVNVRIIDRGPFVEGRIIDLSKAAARYIDLLGRGIGEVRLEVIAAPVDVPAGDFYGVQIGAYATLERAEAMRTEYAARFGGTARIVVKQGASPLWRLVVGRESTAAAAQQIADGLAPDLRGVFVVRLDPAEIDARGVGIPLAPPPASAPPPSASAPPANPTASHAADAPLRP